MGTTTSRSGAARESGASREISGAGVGAAMTTQGGSTSAQGAFRYDATTYHPGWAFWIIATRLETMPLSPQCVGQRWSALLGFPEDAVDLLDRLKQPIGHRGVGRLLGLARRLGGLPEEVVELRVLLEVLGLEVVGPKHPQMVLDHVGPLLLDGDGPLLEHRVVGAVELLHTRLHRVGLDAGLGGVVDAAGKVAVGVGRGRRGKAVEGVEQAVHDAHDWGSFDGLESRAMTTLPTARCR